MGLQVKMGLLIALMFAILYGVVVAIGTYADATTTMRPWSESGHS